MGVKTADFKNKYLSFNMKRQEMRRKCKDQKVSEFTDCFEDIHYTFQTPT